MKATSLLFLFFGLEAAIQATAQSLTSVTVNGLTVPMNVISNYAPEVGLHYWEPYLPCSIDYILAHSTVLYGHPSDYVGNLNDGTNLITHPTQQQLYQIATNDPAGTNYYLSIETAAFTGGPPAGTMPPYDSSVLTNVPMYVSVQVPADRSFVDLNYYFIFAYNGPQTIRGLEPGRHFNAILTDFAKHEGDIEGISVRITTNFQNIVFVRYEAHGDSSYYAPAEVIFDGSHPRVSCALNSHSTYNPKGFNANDWINLKNYSLTEGVDIINDGAIWRPYLNTNLILVGIDTNNQPINGQLWAAFAGRLGIHQLNDFQSAFGVGGSLDFDQQAWAESSGQVIESYFVYELGQNGFTKYDADNVGVGPGGLGGRGSIIESKPTYSIPETTGELFAGVNGGANLVLSVNPADPIGPLIVATYDQNLPLAQQWRRQEWDSHFGTRYVYINKQSGLAMYATGVQGAAITQTAGLTSSNFWQLGGDEGNDFHAVQWANDNGQNLNIPGNGPYTNGSGIVTWSWGGGAGNEIWKFVVPNPVQVPGRIEAAATYNGTNLYMSVDPNNPDGQLVVELFATNAAQIWLRAANGSSSGVTNYTYVNQLSGLMMYAPGGNGGIVSQTNIFSQNTDWYDGTDEGNGYHAIQFGPDIGQNLNIPGDGPYPFGDGLITWGWGGGAPNEIWRFQPTTPPPQQPCLIRSEILDGANHNMVLSANLTNASGEVVIESYVPGDKRQVWLQNTIQRVSGPSYIYVNESSGLALYSPGGNGSLVTLVPYDINNNGMYWNVANPFTATWNALQYAPDSGQNLNVFGDGPYNPGAAVGTWGWSGGAQNEVWQIVADTKPPVLSLPSTIHVQTDPGTNFATVQFTVAATDDFGIATVSCYPQSGSQFPIGTNYVYCSASDPSSNSTPVQSFAVIVQDKEPPKVFCPNSMIVPTDPGQTSAVVYFVALAFDNSGGSNSVTCTPPPGTAFPIGVNTVECVGVDPSGNAATNSFTITVVNPPVLGLLPVASLPFQFSVSGEPGSHFQIQYKDDLNSTGQWQLLQAFTLSNGTETITDPSPTNHRFYRAVMVP